MYICASWNIPPLLVLLTYKERTTFYVNRIMNKLIKHFAEKQKTLFLIDSIGAIMTAFSPPLSLLPRDSDEHSEVVVAESSSRDSAMRKAVQLHIKL
jgi:Mg2+ and Co2+ transporter CorA